MSTLAYDGPTTLTANQLFHARLEVRLDEPVATGGSIVLAVRHFSDLADARDDDPRSEGFVTVHASRDGVRLRLSGENCWSRHPWNRGIELTVEQGTLAAGDRISVILGGERGFRCQSFAEESFRFRLGVRPSRDASWRVSPLPSCPAIRVVGGEASAVRVMVTDATATSPGGRVCLKVEDLFGNLATSDPVELDLLLDDRVPVATARVSGMVELPQVPLPRDTTWHRLTAVSRDGRFFARSNPFGPSLVPGFRLLWGEIHCQSGLCDGTARPSELYRYARGAGGLDFAAVTSHDMLLSPDDWSEVQRATREANDPGRFVTFLGYEWSGDTARGGDNNIYFLADSAPLVYQGSFLSDDLVPAWGSWCDATPHAAEHRRTIAETIAELRRSAGPFLVVPHCGGRIANLDFHDPSAMPILEIHSCHRNYEDIARAAIDRGLHLGFIGGSDDHRGLLGDSRPAARDRFFSARCGLAGVYARDLTREGLWEALLARRVYATNGCRAALVVRAGDVLMGGEVSAAVGSCIRIEFETVLDGLFDYAELMEGTTTIRRFSKNENLIPRCADGVEVTVRRGATFYWVRVVQIDGGMAWSSPIRVAGV